MDEGILFKDLEFDGKLLKDLELVYESSCKDYRMYLSRDDKYSSIFSTLAVQYYGRSGKGDHWQDETLEVTKVFQSKLMFDGIRHLWFCSGNPDDMDGYSYYPNLIVLSQLLIKLSILEIEYTTKTKDEVSGRIRETLIDEFLKTAEYKKAKSDLEEEVKKININP